MDIVDLHARTVAEFLARVDTVGPDQWGGPTPCEEWDVRQLVNHVVNEDRWTTPLLSGRTIEEVGDQFDGDLLGDDPVGAARAAAEEAVTATGELAPAGGHVHLSYGDEDMEEYLRQLSADHLVHGWDLAVATGGDTSFDPELVAEVAAWFAEREAMYRGAGIVAAPVPVAVDDATAKLVGAFGHDPDWSP